jgi:hypothetical protein
MRTGFSFRVPIVWYFRRDTLVNRWAFATHNYQRWGYTWERLRSGQSGWATLIVRVIREDSRG